MSDGGQFGPLFALSFRMTIITSTDPLPHSDIALITRLRADDPTALQALYDRHVMSVRKLALKLLRQEDQADDVVQDVFMALWQARTSWNADGAARLSTWLYKVCVFKCADRRRQNLPGYAYDISDFQDILPSLKDTPRALSRELHALLETLPANQKLVMRLHYEADMDVGQIASRLNTSELSVRSLLKRGKAGLRQKMPGVLNDYLA